MRWSRRDGSRRAGKDGRGEARGRGCTAECLKRRVSGGVSQVPHGMSRILSSGIANAICARSDRTARGSDDMCLKVSNSHNNTINSRTSQFMFQNCDESDTFTTSHPPAPAPRRRPDRSAIGPIARHGTACAGATRRRTAQRTVLHTPRTPQHMAKGTHTHFHPAICSRRCMRFGGRARPDGGVRWE